MSKRLIILNKNHTIEIIKEKKFRYSNKMKYILIPIIEYGIDSYIMLKPNKFMNFTKAEIEIEMAFKVFIDGESTEFYFPIINKEVFSIIELYNYLHSLNRYSYFNDIMGFIINDVIEILTITKFKITLFNNKDIIYEKDIENEYENYEDELYGDGNGPILKIYNLLKDIYTLKDKDIYKKYLFLSEDKNEWKIEENFYKKNENSIIGIDLYNSSSIYFMTALELAFIKNELDSIYSSMYVMDLSDKYQMDDSKYINPRVFEIEYIENDDLPYYNEYEVRFYNIQNIMEYLIYLNMISILLQFIYQEAILDFDTTTEINIYIYLEIKLYNVEKMIKLKLTSGRIISFNQILEKLKKEVNKNIYEYRTIRR